jgi:organic hydroperoxide reductase OsmC/OhrA
MQDFPHHYSVVAQAAGQGDVILAAEGLPQLATAAPVEFGGPGGRWSPESLLVAAVADCFVLSFRAIAGASKFDWRSLHCGVEGVLDRVDRVTQFTEFRVHATLSVPEGTDPAKAERMLARAEQSCLITNSLKAPSHLETTINAAAD